MGYQGRPKFNQVVQTRAMPLSSRPTGRSRGGRFLVALVLAAFAIISYMGSRVYNPITGEDQYINITPEQEIAIGLQAVPEMEQQFGGPEPDQQAQALIDAVGQRLVANSIASQSGYPFEFTLLADQQTINAFALPGGQIFITDALLVRLETEGQLAGVLGHEIVHVIARHGAQQMAQQQLSDGLTGALVMATYDPNDPRTQNTAQVAMMISQLVALRYGRGDELQADELGVTIMSQAGYDPRAMIGVQEVLIAASQGQASQPEILSTHPDPGNRIEHIQAAIDALYPNGVPDGLTP